MASNSDIFVIAPDFDRAITGLHSATMPVALVVCFAGLGIAALRAQAGRELSSIWPQLVRIMLVSVFLVNMGPIGDFVGDTVAALEEETGLNGNPMQAFVNAIKAKFGVDMSFLNNLTPFGSNSPSTSNATKITAYGYPGDTSPDHNSANGIGNHDNQLLPYQNGQSLASAALTKSAAALYGVQLGQTFTMSGSNGQTYTLRYDDTAPQEDNRVDIYDPNSVLTNGGNDNGFGSSVGSLAAGPLENGNLGTFFNSLVHPLETAQVAAFGLFTLGLAFIAGFIMWISALLQSILYYCAIAMGPVFVPFLLVPGLENIARSFLLSFFSIALWPIAWLVSGLVTQLLLGLAVNSGNAGNVGAANAMGMTYLWMICVALWVIASSILGPWIVSKRFLAGANGIADMVVGSRNSAVSMARMGSSAAAGAVGSLDGSVPFRPMPSFSPNYARRPKS